MGRPLRLLILAVGLALPGSARAQQDPDSEPASGQEVAPKAEPAPAPLPLSTPATRLETALRAYQTGQHDLALSQLIALLREQPDDSDVVRQAQVYMGEIFFVQGNRSAAREAFELVLQGAPEYVLDPFQHPPDVCAFFELVRESGSWRPTPPPPPEPEPAARARPSPWLPLGIAQYRQERVAPGVLYTLGQGITCGLSVGLGTWLLLDRSYGSRNEAGIDEETGERLWTIETLQARRSAQWAFTGACYGSYALGVTDAWLAERRYQRRSQAARAGDHALVLTLRGRF